MRNAIGIVLCWLVALWAGFAHGATTISNPEVLAAALDQAETRRITVLVDGDSNSFWGTNGVNGGFGYMGGLSRSLNRKYGTYALGPFPAAPHGISYWNDMQDGCYAGYWGTIIQDGLSVTVPAPFNAYTLPDYSTATHGYLPNDHGTPRNPAYLADGSSQTAGAMNPQWGNPPVYRGTSLTGGSCLLDMDGGYKAHLTYGTFASGSAGVRWCWNVRQDDEDSEYTDDLVLAWSNITPVTGTNALVDTSVTVPAGSYSGKHHWLRFARLGGTEASGNQALYGPFFATYMLCEDHDLDHGVLCGLYLWAGSGTARQQAQQLLDPNGTIAAAIPDYDTAQLEYIRQCIRLQDELDTVEPKVVYFSFIVGNDLDGTSSNSIGPSPAASNTGAGIADNQQAKLTELRRLFALAGVDSKDFVFVPVVYQHWASQTEAARKAVFDALVTYFASDAQVSVVYLDAMSSAEMVALDWDQSGVTTHLSEEGYHAVSAGMLQAIDAGSDGTTTLSSDSLAAIAEAVRTEMDANSTELAEAVSTATAAEAAAEAAQTRVELALPNAAPDTGNGLQTYGWLSVAINDLEENVEDAIGLVPDAADIRAALGLAAADLDTQLAALEPGTSQPRVNRPAGRAYQLKISSGSDGTYKATKPVRLRAGEIAGDGIAVSVDMSPLFGSAYVETVGTPTVSGGSITCAALGPRDTTAMVRLDGTVTASEERTVTVPVEMESGDPATITFDVIGWAD